MPIVERPRDGSGRIQRRENLLPPHNLCFNIVRHCAIGKHAWSTILRCFLSFCVSFTLSCSYLLLLIFPLYVFLPLFLILFLNCFLIALFLTKLFHYLCIYKVFFSSFYPFLPQLYSILLFRYFFLLVFPGAILSLIFSLFHCFFVSFSLC